MGWHPRKIWFTSNFDQVCPEYKSHFSEKWTQEIFLLWLLGILALNLQPTSAVPRRRRWHPTSVLLPGKSHWWRSLVGCNPWGREELDTTEQLHFDFSLSCIGEGNGNPLQCSCLENSRDGGAWWAAIYGVAQSRTRLKRLSSSMGVKAVVHWKCSCDWFGRFPHCLNCCCC